MNYYLSLFLIRLSFSLLSRLHQKVINLFGIQNVFMKLKTYRVISLPKNCNKKKRVNNFNHREYCWDCQTRLECLLVSLVQLQLVTYSNEVKPYIHPLHEKSYTGATSIRISVICGGEGGPKLNRG